MSAEDGVDSPFSNVLHDKALRKAFYNVAAILFTAFASGIAVAVYYILQPFLRPMLWALLCGAFLYPFKYRMATGSKIWLEGLNSSKTPLIVGFLMLPFVLVIGIINALENTFRKHIRIIVGSVSFFVILIIFINFWPHEGFINLLSRSFSVIEGLLSYLNCYLIWSLVLGYSVVVLLFCNEKSQFFLKFLSMLLWGAVFFHIVNVFSGTFAITMSLIVTIMVIGGFLAEMIHLKIKSSDRERSGSFARSMSSSSCSTPCVDSKTLQQTPDADPSHTLLSLNQNQQFDEVKKNSFSDYCLMTLMWSIIVLQLWLYKILLVVILLLLVCIAIKFLGSYFEIWAFLQSWFSIQAHQAKDKVVCNRRFHVIVPKPIRVFIKLIVQCDAKIAKLLEKSIDKICSALIIVLLIFAVFLFAVFTALEVHKESMHLVQVSSNVFNRTHHPELARWLPEDDVLQNTLDSMVKNAYVQGRELIGGQLNGFLQGDDADRDQIEKQVLKLWDALYNTWLNTNKTSESTEKSLSFDDLDINSSIPNFFQKMKNLNLNVVAIAKENVDLFMSVIKSVWSVLVSNVAFTVKIITSMISVIFGGGTAIFNTFLSLVIFLTTLFYLLSTSGDQYMPVELFCTLSPAYLDTVHNFQFGKAFQDAIGSVFLVSCKMSAFYGLYTWFTHSLLGIQIVFIPSVLAAIFAAVPFLGTYMAAVPAILELWLVNGQSHQALLLFIAHYLPTFFIDTAFYSEIKGGHPYLTGLAILGGMCWMGLEGAIIGPILLCCFVVAVHMYQSMLQPEVFCDQRLVT